jgi:hypothetical protein
MRWSRPAAGPYAGAVGYGKLGALTLDTAIAIRTCVMRGDKAWVQAGAGIVADPTRWPSGARRKRRRVRSSHGAGPRGKI